MSEEMKVAIARGTYTALGTFAAAFLYALSAGQSLQASLINGGVVALTVLGFRGGVEGHVDTAKALKDIQARAAQSSFSSAVTALSPITVTSALGSAEAAVLLPTTVTTSTAAPVEHAADITA